MTLLDWSLRRYRPLLSLHVRQLRLGRLYQARFDASDVVQEALTRAFKGFDKVRGQSECEVIAWLKVIVGHVLIDMVREHGAAKRDPSIERSVHAVSEDLDTPLAAYLTACEPGPSTLAVRQEDLLRLAAAMERLPDAEQDAIIAHFILELPLCDVASRLGRTEKGVAGLLFRGKRRLKEMLAEREDLA